ncbi:MULTISPECIES: hypothetical protein [Psychrilyobacter]|uniref:NADP-dependent oxidoreductase domain-containing protein n=1 Tax=Psychrilyobacter piezotolerans TaxID=2293438 RepID=A0ABX9KJ84_9FUSO|nr:MULTISPECIES: hypothetical protein [Psychrilyobacter]MCS5421264.1 hypothetical protein [Psychrilyobacter sp. S5]NDI76979.1 hypothetical protein [Psychrilyobacter piezotolerans]RDE64595.1 hypothetical protein DV867_03380 [Psychrilyobacter sp. S5]REI42407.1 hypothetical protein DYH56_03380 [Psychrilyobacter piezotolerans]
MARYRKIDNKIKKEIKKAYEAGMDLIDISLQYMINYGTLRNLSSKDGWIKGKSKAILQQAFIEDDMSKRVELRDKVITDYRTLHQSNLAYLMELNKSGTKPKVKSYEEALKNRIQATAELYKLGKELFSIQTPSEKIELQLRQIKFEEGKKAIEKRKGIMFMDEDEEE